MTPEEAAKKIIVAIDTDKIEEVNRIVQAFKGKVGMFKVGLQALTALGNLSLVHQIHGEGARVFYDGKWYDIPNTVAGAVRPVTRRAVTFMNMHVECGPEAMRAAVKARDEEWENHVDKGKYPKPAILGVTVLTSLNHAMLVQTGTLPKVGERIIGGSSKEAIAQAVAELEAKAVRGLVLTRATLAKECGIDGIVCSPQEVSIIRETCGQDFRIVVPGIRLPDGKKDDQQRTGTAGLAIKDGADHVVVGRTLSDAKDPESVLNTLIEDIVSSTGGAA